MSDDNHEGPVDRALDLFVYAPLGLAALARDTLPGMLRTFATRGRAELDHRRRTAEEKVGQARTIGRFAVDYGAPMVRRKVEERLTDARGKAEQTFTGLVVRREDEWGEEAAVASAVDVVDATPDEAPEPAPPEPAPPEPAPPEPAPAEPAAVPAANGAATARANGSGAAVGERSPAPSPAALPIPDYDELSASQVVSRLPGLAVEELEAIRAYESGGRGRRTILGKIDQLVR